MAILYAVVARGTVVLAEFAAVTGNTGAVARRILEKLPNDPESRMCFSQDRYIFHVLKADALTFLCMANDTFGRRVPFSYLEDIHMRFMKNYGRIAHSALAYAMNDEFSRVLHQQMEYFSSNPSADTLNRVRGEVAEIHTIMVDNIDKILDRGDRIALLVDKTATMQDSSFHFKKQSRRLRRALWMKNAKLLALLTFSIVLLLYIIIAACCGGKTPVESRSLPVPPKARHAAMFRKNNVRGCSRCIALLDVLLRLCTIGASIAVAIMMGTTDETLPFSADFFQFHASFADLPALTFFVIGNSIAAGYLVLSPPFSLVCVVWPQVMVALITSAAASAASIVSLAHNGDSKANWTAICERFNGFCQHISGAVVDSFVASIMLIFLVIISGFVLRNH